MFRVQMAVSCMVCIIAASLICAAPQMAAQNPISIHGELPFPESLSSSSDGTIFIGSASQGMIFRVTPGSTSAEPWLAAGANGMQRVLGVFTDARTGILWVCSTKIQGEPTALKAFDMKSKVVLGSYSFPGDTGICNDIALSRKGDVYVTDTMNGRILRLRPGAQELEVWVKNDRLIQADGIAFGDAENLYVNTFRTGHLFRIALAPNGSSGTISEVKTSQPLNLPDGLRAIGKNQFLMIEGAGRLDYVTVEGDYAKIQVLKDGFNGPTAVTLVGDTAWVLEGKLKYMNDSAFKGQNPGPFKVYPVHIQHPH